MSWEGNVRKVVPYVAGEQPKEQDVIKLNTNENPYPPAPGVAAAIRGFDCDVLRRTRIRMCLRLWRHSQSGMDWTKNKCLLESGQMTCSRCPF